MKGEIVQLKKEEEIVGLIRQSLVSKLFHVFLVVFWILLPFFLFFVFLHFGIVGIVLFCILAASGIAYGVKQWIMWRHTMLIITDQRIIDVEQFGFFQREISELALKEISNVSAKKNGLLGKMFDFGSLRVETTQAMSYDLELPGVAHPLDVSDLILEVQYITDQQQSGDTFHVSKL
jgi:uncharacterized membrane protein YdbT with pleckstrin-like domain